MKLDIRPYSNEWFELRKKTIGSTDAGIIMGTNKFNGNSPNKLMKLKLGLIEKEEANDAMKMGMELEGDARKWFEKEKKIAADEAVYISDEYSWMIATLDGDIDNDSILEIKCGAVAYEKAKDGNIISCYWDQMQHAMYVANKKRCYYVCFQLGLEPIIILIERDDLHIKKLLEKEIAFYEKWQNTIEAQDDWRATMKSVIYNNDLIKKLEAANDEMKEGLYAKFENKNVIFKDFNIIMDYANYGSTTDWSAVCEAFGIEEKDLDNFKKAKKSSYKVINI